MSKEDWQDVIHSACCVGALGGAVSRHFSSGEGPVVTDMGRKVAWETWAGVVAEQVSDCIQGALMGARTWCGTGDVVLAEVV